MSHANGVFHRPNEVLTEFTIRASCMRTIGGYDVRLSRPRYNAVLQIENQFFFGSRQVCVS